ncbi:MAG: hypothetical protein KF850_08585 [Labilithrix sp.]|nr:hypothetical protein [Labilithrix sp.]
MTNDSVFLLREECEKIGLKVLSIRTQKWSIEFRRRWRTEFALPETDWRRVMYDWEALGTELAPALLRRPAIREFNVRRKEPRTAFVTTSLDYRDVLEVEGDLPEYAWWRVAVRNEDLYIVHSSWAWTFVLAHEERAMGIGPFFVENVKSLMV